MPSLRYEVLIAVVLPLLGCKPKGPSLSDSLTQIRNLIVGDTLASRPFGKSGIVIACYIDSQLETAPYPIYGRMLPHKAPALASGVIYY